MSVLFNDGTSLVWSTDKVVNPTIRRGVNGMGMSGVVQSCLTFGIPVEYMQELERRAASVKLLIFNGQYVSTPMFYVDSRQLNDGIVNFTCYDRLAFADGINITERDMAEITQSEVDCDGIVRMIANKLRISFDENMFFISPKISRYAVVGKSCAQILTDISTANFGVFCIDETSGADTLKFTPFYGQMTNFEHIVNQNCTEIKLSDPIKFGGYILTDSNRDEYTYNADSVDYIINVGADFYQPLNVASNIKNSVIDAGWTYQPFTIDKAEVSGLMSINQIIFEDGKSLRINNIEFTVDSSGMYARLMCNAATLNEIAPYCSRMQRAIDEAIKLGTGYGKNKEMRLTPYQGIIYVDTEVKK